MAGWGLLKFRRWAHLLALSPSVLMFVVIFLGGINFAVQSYNAMNAPAAEIPEGSVAFYYSVWPTYITSIGSGILIWKIEIGSGLQDGNI